MMRAKERTMPTWRRLGALFAGIALGLVMAACSSGGSTTTQQPGTPQVRPNSPAQLAIVLPKNGETVTGPSVELKVSLKGAEIVPAVTTKLSPDKGHLHVYLDNNLVSMTFGLDQMIPNVAPGQHVLRVEFVASDHAPFDPRVFQSVVFEVK
jgi:hypothetical protein